MPRVSVITTVFNEAPYLEHAVQSLLHQTHSDIEVIVVDDGSTDDTAATLAPFLADPRLKLARQVHAGLSVARNTALRMVTGDYVTFLDADDHRPGYAIADLVACLKPGTDMVVSRGLLKEYDRHPEPFYDDLFFNELARGGKPSDEKRRFIALLCEPQCANKLISVPMLRHFQLGFPSTHYFEDIYFHMLSVVHARMIEFCHSRTFVYNRRYRKRQITADTGTVRYDVLSSCCVTLNIFASTGLFVARPLRSALLASVLRVVRWCETMLGRAEQWDFRQAAKAMFLLQSPLYREFDFNLISDEDRKQAAVRSAAHYGLA